jgi:integrase
MPDEIKLPEYCATHRNRERGMENGYVTEGGGKNKKWIGHYHVYIRHPDGSEKRMHRKRVVGLKSKMTKAQAEDAHRGWVRNFHRAPVADSPKTTFRALAEKYYGVAKGDWSTAWRQTKQSLYNVHLFPAFGERAVDSITPEELKNFINSLPNREWRASPHFERDKETGQRVIVPGKLKHGASVSLIKKIITEVRKIFRIAISKKLITENPAENEHIKLTVPKTARKPNKQWFPPHEIVPLVKQLTPRNSLLVRISLYGGLRPNETMALHGGDISPEGLQIERALDPRNHEIKDTKDHEARPVQLPPKVMRDLRAWIAEHNLRPDELIFQQANGKPLNSDSLRKWMLRPAAKRAGIRTLDVDWRMLRRSFATVVQLVKAEVKSIQAQLGHSTPEITVGVYQQPIDELLAEQLEELEQMIDGDIPMPPAAARLQARLIQMQSGLIQ